jgi:hypothetical protein
MKTQHNFFRKHRKKLLLVLISVVLLGVIGSTPQKEMDATFLDKELQEIQRYLPYRDSVNTEVSEASVAWHLDHSLITVNKIYTRLYKSDESKYKNRFNFTRTLVFTLNKIPRGRAESPKVVRPKELVLDTIEAHYESALQNIKAFDSLPKKAHFTHPFFGMLNRRQTRKFLKIHTNHHLKIVKDILKEKSN